MAGILSGTYSAPCSIAFLNENFASYIEGGDDSIKYAKLAALHGKEVGGDAQLGRGIVFCGLWKQIEFNISEEQQ